MRMLLVQLLMFYKRKISPGLGAKCRYTPSCSIYAAGSIYRFGVIKGVLMAVWRLLRCNPFSRGGYDPVPEKLKGDIIWVL